MGTPVKFALAIVPSITVSVIAATILLDGGSPGIVQPVSDEDIEFHVRTALNQISEENKTQGARALESRILGRLEEIERYEEELSLRLEAALLTGPQAGAPVAGDAGTAEPAELVLPDGTDPATNEQFLEQVRAAVVAVEERRAREQEEEWRRRREEEEKKRRERMMERFQSDLGLSLEDSTKLFGVLDHANQQRRELFEKLREGRMEQNRDGGPDRREDMRAAFSRIGEERDAQLAQLLTEPQLESLRRIEREEGRGGFFGGRPGFGMRGGPPGAPGAPGPGDQGGPGRGFRGRGRGQ